tara:strand:+ start:708 stop:878 length:171 start_codon:yes stop_codon:yes gene_type:complete
MLNKNWDNESLTYAIYGAGNMTCEQIGEAINKSGEAVYIKLRRIGYLGKLHYGARA